MVKIAHAEHAGVQVQGHVPGGARTRAADGPAPARDSLRQAGGGHRTAGARTPTRMARGHARHRRDPRRPHDPEQRIRHVGGRLKLLLDTHIWLWSQLAPERLSKKVARALEAPTSELWLSPISVWEFF